MLPSGETFDLVIPGMFNVVAGGRIRGVVEPEPCRIGGLKTVSKVVVELYLHDMFEIHNSVLIPHETLLPIEPIENSRTTYIRGDPGAVEGPLPMDEL